MYNYILFHVRMYTIMVTRNYIQWDINSRYNDAVYHSHDNCKINTQTPHRQVARIGPGERGVQVQKGRTLVTWFLYYGSLSNNLEGYFLSEYRHNLPYIPKEYFPVTCKVPWDFPPPYIPQN